MNIGEAIAYGLMGGTAAAADHYVADWRERTRMAREQADRKEGWTHEEELAEKQRTFLSGESKTEREFRTKERLGDQTYQSQEAIEDSKRQIKLAEEQARITEKYRDKGQQFTFDENNKMVPVKPGEEAFTAPAAQLLDGKWSYHGVGKDGKGLLKGGRSGSGSAKNAGGYETLKTPGSAGITEERTLYRDPETGQEFTYAADPQTGQIISVPIQSGSQVPATAERVAEANTFAEQTVNDLAGMFSTDASDFEPWGGSRTAAKEYFRQGYLDGSLFNDQGQVVMPGQGEPEVREAVAAGQMESKPQDKQAASVKHYQSLSPEKQQQVQQFINGINQGRDRDQMALRMLELGFTEDELNILFPAI